MSYRDSAFIINLVTYQPSRKNKLLATGAALLLSLTFFLVMFEGDRLFPILPQFIIIHATTIFWLEILTALILFSQFHLTRELHLLPLASAYFIVGIFAPLQMLVFPLVFSERGLFDADLNTAVWIWTIWHFSFPLLVSCSILLSKFASFKKVRRRKSWIALTVMASLLFVYFALHVSLNHPEWLPRLMEDQYDFSQMWSAGIAQVLLAVNITALLIVVFLTRLKTIVYLWLFIAVLAANFDTLGNLLTTQRYSMGWYGARIQSVVSSAAVLGALLGELYLLYMVGWREKTRMQLAAETDELTKLPNRRAFNARALAEAKRASRFGEPLSVVLIDVDHFKRFNDDHGHDIGDLCLQHVAEILHAHVSRSSDFAARWGGEEFIVLLYGTSADGAHHFAEGIRADVEQQPFKANHKALRVTASFGVACSIPDSEEDLELLITRADKALYQAKQQGRNRVALSTATAKHGIPKDSPSNQ